MAKRRLHSAEFKAKVAVAALRGDRLVVLSEGYKCVLCERGVPTDRIDVIYNGCDQSQIPPSDSLPAALGPGGEAARLRVLHAGNVGRF